MIEPAAEDDPGTDEPSEKAASVTQSTDYSDRYLGALETAVRTLIPLSILFDQAGTDLHGFPLTDESPFPLPPRFVSAAVYLTGYLLDGDIRLHNLYSAECEGIKRDIPTEISPTVQVYGA